MISSVVADMATTPLRTALGRTKDAFMALEGAPKATCVIGKIWWSATWARDVLVGRRARRGSEEAKGPRRDGLWITRVNNDHSRPSEPVATGRIAPLAAYSRRLNSPPKGEGAKSRWTRRHTAIGARDRVLRRTLLEALTGAFAETRRVIMVEVMAAIFLCVCCVSDATNDAGTHRLRAEKRKTEVANTSLVFVDKRSRSVDTRETDPRF